MSSLYNFRPRKPTLAIGVAITGLSLWAVSSYFTNKVFAEELEPPPAFSSRFGTSLRLQSSESVNHNTKRLRFEFPTRKSRSGLTLQSSVLIVAWPKGSLFPVLRPYTPINPPDQRGHIDLLVKQYPSGKASAYLHSLPPGSSLYFLTTLPGYRWTPNQHVHITLIAGGAGITPIYQLILGILSNPLDRTAISLIFGVNSDADAFLCKELDELENRFPGRFKKVVTVSNPSKGSVFRRGYVTKELLREVVGEGGRSGKVFVCGPPGMERALLGGWRKGGVLQEMGFEKGQIYKF